MLLRFFRMLATTFPTVAFLSFLVSDLSANAPPILYPRASESREVKSLDGLWDFSLSPTGRSITGFREKWFSGKLRELSDSTIQMPVPSSYNDVTEDKKIRDYVGVVWYERRFFVPRSWAQGQRVWIRFGSVCYAAQVWINGQLVTSHEVGHLPFEEEVSAVLRYGEENVIAVAVDNTLLQTTVPQGFINEVLIGNTTHVNQQYTFDFFNYAGIDRPVVLYTTPQNYIKDITVTTLLANNNKQGTVKFAIDIFGEPSSTVTCRVSLIEKTGTVVGVNENCNGSILVEAPKLWWPYLMDPSPGYMYTLQVEVTSSDGVKDVYRQPVGIRVVSWTNKTVLINGKPIYIRGFGRHEDSDFRGKGLDLPLILKDNGLIKWIGANAYRTSHYPYAEEIMDLADQHGIMIINECPSVDTDIFTATLLANHKTALSELIQRDKNRPSVIMWSVANEPRSQHPPAEPYFREVIAHVKSLDTSRPVTIAISRTYGEDKVAQLLDVISFNRYNAWYTNPGRTETITESVVTEAENWHKRFNKPVLMSEYGADTVAGLHRLPDFVWSEEYQSTVLMEHFKAFDILRSRGYFIGEMIWNFADFMTAQCKLTYGATVGAS